MKRVLFLGGTHTRHLYYANHIAKNYGLAGAIIQKREAMIPEVELEIPERDRENNIRHFKDRDDAENKYFGDQHLPGSDTLSIAKEELYGSKVIDYIEKIKPEIAFVFGCAIIKHELRRHLPKDTINLHLGLSPRYRGAATLFWPFYFLEPNFAGATFHYLLDEPDAGEIIHQICPSMQKEDGIHDIGCKTVLSAAEQAVLLLQAYDKNGFWKTKKQKATGKNFLASDFQPAHLRLVYDVYDNKIVQEYLAGNLRSKDPLLFNQFKDD
jgi:methionyl-tRNA formyltransferase